MRRGLQRREGVAASLRTAFLDKYLDPASSVGEILFGLIMTLTFTLGAGLMIKEEGAEGARELLIATVGCNVAWGVIDGVLYIFGETFERGRRRRLMQLIQSSPSAKHGTSYVAEEFDELLSPVTTEAERLQLYERIAERVRGNPIPRNRITKADLLGGFASFWLVFLASLPAALPFLFIEPAHLALRISNAFLLAMLFLTGWIWAGYTVARRWATGLSLMLGGVALVALAIALGG
jgi:VIT family protein